MSPGDEGQHNDPAARSPIRLPWDTEPQDKWRIQFQYTSLSGIAKNAYSLASDNTSEGGGFQYEKCPEIFLGRRGYGALRVAWDTNILIDYAQYGAPMWEADEFSPAIKEGRYQQELVALCELMHFWLLRDVRIRMPLRQLDDAKRRLSEQRRDLRLWQLMQFSAALSCISLDANIDENVEPFDSLSDGSSNDEWDKSLVEEAVVTGCHVFLTGDRSLKRRLGPMARKSFVQILSPTDLLDLLAETGELSLARVGQELLPDSHKWVHIMDAHERGYPGQA